MVIRYKLMLKRSSPFRMGIAHKNKITRMLQTKTPTGKQEKTLKNHWNAWHKGQETINDLWTPNLEPKTIIFCYHVDIGSIYKVSITMKTDHLQPVLIISCWIAFSIIILKLVSELSVLTLATIILFQLFTSWYPTPVGLRYNVMFMQHF